MKKVLAEIQALERILRARHEDTVDLIQLKNGKDGWVIIPTSKGKPVPPDSFDHATKALLAKKFDYSDEAHDAAQKVFRHAQTTTI